MAHQRGEGMTRLTVNIVGLLFISLGHTAVAQTYPSKPVRFVVPFVPGGPTDIQGRMLGEKLSQRLGQQVIIDNRGGAGGNIGMDLTAKSPPDGYTIVIATVGTWAVNPYLYQLLELRELALQVGVVLLGRAGDDLGADFRVPLLDVRHSEDLHEFLVQARDDRGGRARRGANGRPR